VLAAAQTIEDEDARAEALTGLALSLPEALLQRAWEAARAMKDARARAEALTELVPHLPKAVEDEVREHIAVAMEQMEDVQAEISSLIEYYPQLCESAQNATNCRTPAPKSVWSSFAM
jgi:hypothetical protein